MFDAVATSKETRYLIQEHSCFRHGIAASEEVGLTSIERKLSTRSLECLTKSNIKTPNTLKMGNVPISGNNASKSKLCSCSNE